MGRDIIETLSYSSFFWSLGTTSFRTKEFNYSIEKQLACLDDFWKIPENSNQGWEKKYMAPGQKDIYDIKNRYYDFMRERGLTVGDDKVKYKAAREKTSGLVDLGLINENHRLTEVGRKILAVSKSSDYKSDNQLLISKDSYVYLKQLLKLSVEKAGGVRPLVVLLYMFSKLGHLSYDEFTYLAPLCISSDVTEWMIEEIEAVRDNKKSVDDIIADLLLSRQNYQEALKHFHATRIIDEDLMLVIGMNRKSRKGEKSYDKAYYPLYIELRKVFIEGDYSRCYEVYKATSDITLGGWWRKMLFDTTSSKAISKAPYRHLRKNPFSEVHDEETLKDVFFRTMHLFKVKSTLHDYFDLNRRYLNIANVMIFEDEQVKLDLVPKHFFASAIDKLYQSAYTPSAELEQDCKMEDICPALRFNEEDVVKRLNKELGIELKTIEDAYAVANKQRYDRFRAMVDTRFTDNDLLGLLDDFDSRNDDEISKKVTDNADTPTIFEYVLGIIWYKVSGYKGRILDYMKLSLDANLLPITHAAGGEADIVYEYSATEDYPAHTLLLEATLADSTNQRRMEMEPVSRHLGNHILRTNNKSSYCLFATNYLDKNVISDFRGRKHMVFYDTRDESHYLMGMKIIPVQTSDLRSILMTKKKYSELYPKYERAYQKDMEMLPVHWYETCVKEKTDISSFLQAPELSEFADDMMKAFQGISILKLQQACIDKFGDTYCTMKIGDWYHVVKDYIERQTKRYDIRDDEEVTWMIAAESSEFAPIIATD
jgi:hypothetical protein